MRGMANRSPKPRDVDYGRYNPPEQATAMTDPSSPKDRPDHPTPDDDAVRCVYCKEDINEDATVCRHCGAYAVETDDEILWFRQGDSPSKVAWSKWWPWAAAVVVSLVGVLLVLKGAEDAERKVKEDVDVFLDCIDSGEVDCEL